MLKLYMTMFIVKHIHNFIFLYLETGLLCTLDVITVFYLL